MTQDELKQIKDSLKETVQETVNGKIDKIHEILEKQNEVQDDLKNKVEKHFEADTTWKEDAKAVIEMGKNVKSFGIVFTYALGLISVIMGVLLAVKKYFE